jgi:hypothetical protein
MNLTNARLECLLFDVPSSQKWTSRCVSSDPSIDIKGIRRDLSAAGTFHLDQHLVDSDHFPTMDDKEDCSTLNTSINHHETLDGFEAESYTVSQLRMCKLCYITF